MISTAQYTITTSPTMIVSDTIPAEEVHIHCASGTVYIGNGDVTINNGLRMDNGDKLTFQNHVGAIYCVTSAGAPTISVMVIEK